MKTSHPLIATVLFFTAHLGMAYFLVGALLVALQVQGSENQQFDLASKGFGLALLSFAWVVALLTLRLWQRRWLVAGGLAVLLVVDGLAMCAGVLLMGVMGVTPDG